MLRRLVDDALTKLSREQVPARLLERLVRDMPERELFSTTSDDSPIGIYIHIPFCATKCSFCGYSVELDRNARLKHDYALAIRTHLLRLAPQLRRHTVSWVSFGGGTPSSLDPAQLEIILDGLTPYRRSDDLSISMEMRIDSLLEPDKLARYIALGVSRVSLGAQSFDDHVRRAFGLRPSAARAFELLGQVRAAGIEFSLDLIWGGPQQRHADLDVTLDRVFELEPHQIDAYPLFPIEGTTQFATFETLDAAALRKHQRAQCDHLTRRMSAAGYRRIDGVMFSRVKDVAEDPRGGFREASSLLVPETGHVVGIGQSAHTLYAGRFATNPYSTRKYVDMIQRGDELTYTGVHAPRTIAAFRRAVAYLARDWQPGRAHNEDAERNFYGIRFWWHVFVGLRGWNALSNKLGYPIGNKHRARSNVDPRFVTADELSKSLAVRRPPPRNSLPVVS